MNAKSWIREVANGSIHYEVMSWMCNPSYRPNRKILRDALHVLREIRDGDPDVVEQVGTILLMAADAEARRDAEP